MDKQTISIINGVEISAVSDENHNIFVPVKPICDAIGVDYPDQFNKLRAHEILSSTIVLSTMVAADGKKREMVCLPLEYVYGWIFTINPRNVAESTREKVLQYQRECTTSSIDISPDLSAAVSKKMKPRSQPSKLSTKLSLWKRKRRLRAARPKSASKPSGNPVSILVHVWICDMVKFTPRPRLAAGAFRIA